MCVLSNSGFHGKFGILCKINGNHWFQQCFTGIAENNESPWKTLVFWGMNNGPIYKLWECL